MDRTEGPVYLIPASLPDWGVQLVLGWEIVSGSVGYKRDGKSTPGCSKEAPMANSSKNNPAASAREERIEELMQQLRPKMEEALRHMVERAVDTPEHEEFGAIEYEFRDAGLRVANDVRQASLASRKKRGT